MEGELPDNNMESVPLYQVFFYAKRTWQMYLHVKCTFMASVPLCHVCEMNLHVKCTFMWNVPLCKTYLYVKCTFMWSVSLCQMYFYVKCVYIKCFYVKCILCDVNLCEGYLYVKCFMWNVLCEVNLYKVKLCQILLTPIKVST